MVQNQTFDVRSQNFRVAFENKAASLLTYLSSVQVRGDTKLSLGIGMLAGLAIVAAMAAYPGKPIDYTGVGESLSLTNHRLPGGDLVITGFVFQQR